MKGRRLIGTLALLALIGGSFSPLVAPRPVNAAPNILYVDGKTGSDSNAGSGLGDAFRTIAAAANALPSKGGAAGWTIRVVGYTDHIYRERPVPPGWDRKGTADAPIVFEAVGYNGGPSGYTKPIVSGGDVAPASGTTWTTAGAAVWKTPWPAKPFAFGTLSGSLRTAVFQDTTGWLWEQASLEALAAAANTGTGGYWWNGGQLYIAPRNGTTPTGHTFDVIMRNGFYFYGVEGVAHVTVRGFEMRHAANGISFAKGVDGGTATDNRAIGNLLMGFAVSGRMVNGTADPATGAVIARNEGAYNTLQAVKVDEGSVNATVCDNNFHHNGLQGIKVQGPPGGTGYTGITSGTLVCRNSLHDQQLNPTGTIYNNASGLTIANGARGTRVEQNKVWNNAVGIHVTQESAGHPAMTGSRLSSNRVWSNTRFGLNLFDGSNGSGAGDLVASHDLYWANGIGVMVDRGASNKTLSHVTVWDNSTAGIKIGVNQTNPASAVVANSLVTNNGGYGVWLVTGNSGTLSYDGISGNAGGNVYGTPATTAVNSQPPAYLSTSSSEPGFLTIGADSYQFSAGPDSSPIGALWADGFIDVAGSTFAADIQWLLDEGITSGCSANRFCPDASVTRGQMAAFLVRALGLPSTTSDYFTDDAGTTFENDINRLAEAGITRGCTGTTFCPNATVSRGQMAAFLVRALGLPSTALEPFDDVAASTFENDINRLAAADITRGCTATMFCPDATVTRGQMAAFLHRAFE